MANDKKFIETVFEKFESLDEFNRECIGHYDADRDGKLNFKECSKLMEDVFQSKTYTLTPYYMEQIFNLLDEDKTMKPVSAFIIVDVQNDFITGSMSLLKCPAGQDGEEVIPVINNLLDTVPFDLIVYTKDWHPEDHISFVENVTQRPLTRNCKVKAEDAKVYDVVEFDGPPRTEQKLWPKHCVTNTWGSELHPDLKIAKNAQFVNKGHHSEVDSYSAFWDNNKLSQTELVKILAKHKVTDVFVCGVAYDICVGYTAFHSLEHGFRTILVEDACRGVDVKAIEETKQKLLDSGAIIVKSSQVNAIVTGEDRPTPLGLQTAKNVALARELVNRGIVK
ncbi:nicotinamidase-like isoform X2 [Dreissena polymorpha]|uniref:nicotinamidase-like isoform X2 n=1 Tax=Dreissena polymorpha TaxID=45954 RepID=UPI00226413CF|nr:nicotinamidase-like isoform X2 [Dreissena polymorpha]XP_052278206.1 nicotinamidase-like isoform X2 [Dreissena polymorpha]